jgi:hypothetical protein
MGMIIQLRPRPAPALAETMKTLANHGADNEAADLHAAAEWITQTHTGAAQELPNGTFGTCTTCHQPWPCPPWKEIQAITLSWLVTASNAAISASRNHLRSRGAA